MDLPIPEPKDLSVKKPKDFNESGEFGLNKAVKLPSGNIHWGTTIDGIPHGYGRMKFKKKFNKHA